MTDTTFNGWANYETWNVALYIQNEYAMYKMALGWAEHGYKSLAHQLNECFGPMTADGVSWFDSQLDTDELNEMLQEL